MKTAKDLIRVRVEEITREAVDIASYRLVREDAAALPPFSAGSHIDVHVKPGLVRQYSLCSAPHSSDSYLIAVKREPASRGGSQAMHERIECGATLHISKPRNNFMVSDQGKYSHLVAAGIGITPILSMASELDMAGRPFEIDYFVRSLDHAAFTNFIHAQGWSDRLRLHVGLDARSTGNRLLTRFLRHRQEGHLYMCGPSAFMDAVDKATRKNWPEEAIHREYFTKTPVLIENDEEGFFVVLARSKQEIFIPPGRSILEMLQLAGIAVEVSCEQGICGTCLTRVVEGQPRHRDSFLSSEEKKAGQYMLPCVSRACGSRIVLDL